MTNSHNRSVLVLLLLIFVLVNESVAFTVPPSHHHHHHVRSHNTVKTTTTTALQERQWNFNPGRGPFGLKKNAEIWNGRVAQVAFVVTLLQELITGKGVIQGIQEGDTVNLAVLGVTIIGTVGLSVLLAIKGKDTSISS